MKKNSKNGHEYAAIVVMFVVIFGCFIAALATIMPSGSAQRKSVNSVSAFDLEIDEGYVFVETEGRNGIRYYVITKDENFNNAPTSAEHNGGADPVTEAAARPQPATTSPTSSTGPTTAATTALTETTVAVTTTTSANTQQSDSKVAYLTFDDGPSENTEKILDILDTYNVKATFFVIYHKNMESKYQEIVERGHTIALHSYTHNYRTVYASEDAYFEDLEKIHDYVYSVTGVDSHLIRFPGGSSNTISNKYCRGIMDHLKEDVEERGYIYHDWNVDSTDASGNNRSPEVLLNNVQADLKSRTANILMHDTGKSKQTTVEALPSIIEYVRSQGYEIEPITEDSKAIHHR